MKRGICPACGREVAVRQDGLARLHRYSRGDACPGSNREPAPLIPVPHGAVTTSCTCPACIASKET